jgi:hypothetical protein
MHSGQHAPPPEGPSHYVRVGAKTTADGLQKDTIVPNKMVWVNNTKTARDFMDLKLPDNTAAPQGHCAGPWLARQLYGERTHAVTAAGNNPLPAGTLWSYAPEPVPNRLHYPHIPDVVNKYAILPLIAQPHTGTGASYLGVAREPVAPVKTGATQATVSVCVDGFAILKLNEPQTASSFTPGCVLYGNVAGWVSMTQHPTMDLRMRTFLGNFRYVDNWECRRCRNWMGAETNECTVCHTSGYNPTVYEMAFPDRCRSYYFHQPYERIGIMMPSLATQSEKFISILIAH